MKVSIVTISFNQAQYLERAIVSVLNQTHPDVEYIVVDPGSTDGSREIIERYRDRIAHVVFEKDKGASDGLNKGFARATGDVLGYINSDDALLPEAAAEAVAALQQSGADIVCGDGFLIDADGFVLRRFQSAPYSLRRAAYAQSVFVQQSTFFRRSAYEAAGGFNPANRVNWDAELMIDMVRRGARVTRRARLWSLYTIHSASITGSLRLADLQRTERERQFEVIMGRPRKPIDRLLAQRARFLRWLLDPRAVVERLVDRAFDPRRRFPNFATLPAPRRRPAVLPEVAGAD